MSGLFTVMVIETKEGFDAELRISVEADLIAYKFKDQLIELRRFDDLELAREFQKQVRNGEYSL